MASLEFEIRAVVEKCRPWIKTGVLVRIFRTVAAASETGGTWIGATGHTFERRSFGAEHEQ